MPLGRYSNAACSVHNKATKGKPGPVGYSKIKENLSLSGNTFLWAFNFPKETIIISSVFNASKLLLMEIQFILKNNSLISLFPSEDNYFQH